MKTKKYDIFISYRRSSYDTANLIATRLKSAGYSVFFDMGTLRSGKFNEQLFNVIETCNDFVLVLPQGALDRCVNEDDWVRLEVQHAMKNNKNIIPVMLNGFQWPPKMPEGLEELCNYHALTASSVEYFDLSMERLQRSYLSSKRHFRYRKFTKITFVLVAALALLATVRTFDRLQLPRTGIIGVTMPGFGTTDRTYQNALDLMRLLGVSVREINIKEACIQHFKDIEHDIDVHDTTYENSQARERTQLLMDVANRENAIVIGTGDLSELALGWATYNGDHMSMYGMNAGIPKTLVRHLVQWEALNTYEAEVRDILLDIVNTPISPELIPAKADGTIKQKTEDLVGPYELHDFFIYHFLRSGYRPRKIYYLACLTFEGQYDTAIIKKWLTTFFRRFFQQQFKRSCLPDGPKVGSVSLSPRGDWRMPSDASAASWLAECDAL